MKIMSLNMEIPHPSSFLNELSRRLVAEFDAAMKASLELTCKIFKLPLKTQAIRRRPRERSKAVDFEQAARWTDV